MRLPLSQCRYRLLIYAGDLQANSRGSGGIFEITLRVCPLSSLSLSRTLSSLLSLSLFPAATSQKQLQRAGDVIGGPTPSIINSVMLLYGSVGTFLRAGR